MLFFFYYFAPFQLWDDRAHAAAEMSEKIKKISVDQVLNYGFRN